MGRLACRIIAMTKRNEVATLLPYLNKQHARRMKADLAYQKRLASRAQELAKLASDEVSLNEAERRRTVESEPQEDITKLQLNHAMHIVADSLELSGKR